MSQLVGEQQVYHASDGGSITDQAHRERMLANFMAPAVLHLKVGAQVMLIKNTDETLVNGSMGRILRFLDATNQDELLGGVAKDGHQPNSTGTRWPVVEFVTGGYVKEVLVCPAHFTVELPSGEVQVSRTQVCAESGQPGILSCLTWPHF